MVRRLAFLAAIVAVAAAVGCRGIEPPPSGSVAGSPGAQDTPGVGTPTATASPTATPDVFSPAVTKLLEQAKTADRERYLFAIGQGATIVPTSDGRAFALVWYPGKQASSPPPFIATLHGHGSWAFDEFFLWHQFANERGYAIVALQWWFGGGETQADYYQPNEINRELSLILGHEEAARRSVLLHGFSRGSANIYGVAAFDNAAGEGYYLLTVANAGKAGSDFAINTEIERGRFGPAPFAGTNWVTFCGGLDPHPDRDGCPGMQEAAAWVTKLGGTVLKAIEDPAADHGGFHRNPPNVNAALDVFAELLKAR